jgi:pyruvate ferredoxin oxidoreductase alpha subunit
MVARDAREAIAIAEGAVTQRVLCAVDGLEVPSTNAFGEAVTVERGKDVPALVHRAAQAAASGERVAVVASALDLAAARNELAHASARRLGLVIHCIEENGGPRDPLSESGVSSALSLGDLPWGMLVAVGAAESLDLALVARRAAEDSGCPFVVLHERSRRRRQELLVAPHRELVEAFLGGPRPPAAPDGDARAVGERVPFALASALREMEALSVRRLDVLERTGGADASLAFVGFGSVGESMLAEVERLRGAGHDVAAIRLVAWRPFPGPRLVKAIGRAVAVTVLDAVERPLGGGGPLAVELKAAFADALTWAPGFPGIGRIPRIASGACPAWRELERGDVDAMVDNMLADERGTRTVTLALAQRVTHGAS